jgi:hypothetical protein
MVLIGAAQTTALFETNDQMGIPHVTVPQLQNEDISTFNNLSDFDKDTLQQVAENLRQPGERVQDPTPGAVIWEQRSQLHRLFSELSPKSVSWQQVT